MQKGRWIFAASLLALLFTAPTIIAQEVGFYSLPVLRATTPVPSSSHVPGDVDGNGVSDLFFLNPSTSQLGYWLMDTNDATGAVTQMSFKTFSIPQGYLVGAIGDFNGDGLADIVLTSNNHDLYLLTNNGKGGFTSRPIGSYAAGWTLLGAGDIDGDGQDDLLWLNSSTCQFSYWLMKNGAPVKTKTIDITCGYSPVSIGYYTPSNRLSILWANATQDLYVWDSLDGGFISHSLGSYGPNSQFVALGGGFEGKNMSVVYVTPTETAFGIELDRTFNYLGLQTRWNTNFWWLINGSSLIQWSSPNFLIEGRGTNMTGVIYYNVPLQQLQICPPVGGAGEESTPAPMPNTCPDFFVPSGWLLVGAINSVP